MTPVEPDPVLEREGACEEAEREQQPKKVMSADEALERLRKGETIQNVRIEKLRLICRATGRRRSVRVAISCAICEDATTMTRKNSPVPMRLRRKRCCACSSCSPTSA